jgi:hypothetical protein
MAASVSAAATSATSAANSATAAATSQSSAATSASSALTSQTSAATSASSALTSQTSAATSATSAATSASSALTSQTSAATSATSSAVSAVLASEWATKTTGTVDGVEYSAKYYASIANPGGAVNAASYTSKGVVLVGTGVGAFTQLSAGSNNQYLVVDTSTATGLKYITLPDPISPLLLMGA